jgi:hypothetical protein
VQVIDREREREREITDELLACVQQVIKLAAAFVPNAGIALVLRASIGHIHRRCVHAI